MSERQEFLHNQSFVYIVNLHIEAAAAIKTLQQFGFTILEFKKKMGVKWSNNNSEHR